MVPVLSVEIVKLKIATPIVNGKIEFCEIISFNNHFFLLHKKLSNYNFNMSFTRRQLTFEVAVMKVTQINLRPTTVLATVAKPQLRRNDDPETQKSIFKFLMVVKVSSIER